MRDICTHLAGRSTVAIALASLVFFSGCGTGRIPTYAVNGAVTVDGSPAEGAIVVFCPVEDPVPEVANLRPAGKTDSSGQFTLTTFDPSDGAPAGEYKILVKWPSATPGNAREDRPGGANKGPDRLKGKYYNQDTTQLSATIKKGSNNLPPFALQTK